MKKKYYRMRTHFDIDCTLVGLDGITRHISLPDGVIGVSPVFSNKKKALKFLKDRRLPTTLLEEITLVQVDRTTGLEI